MWDKKQIETDGKLVELPSNYFNKSIANKQALLQLLDNESDCMTATSRDSKIIKKSSRLLSHRFIRDRSNSTNLTKLNTTTCDGEFHSPGDEVSVEEQAIMRTLKNRSLQNVLRPIKPPYKHPTLKLRNLKSN
jgi:hypothetical protein